MRIDGNYSQIGKDMLLALQSANQDQQIERHELAQLRQAAYTDGHLSAGEAQLLQQLELLPQLTLTICLASCRPSPVSWRP